MASQEIQQYLKDHKEVLATNIEEVYKGQKEDDFWRRIKQTNFHIGRIYGKNFDNRVDSFLDCCIFHESDVIVLDVFESLCEDIPGEDSAIYLAYEFVRNKISGTK